MRVVRLPFWGVPLCLSLALTAVGGLAKSGQAQSPAVGPALTQTSTQALPIRQAYELALLNDPRWQSAQAQARSRAERLEQAKGAWLPAVNASLGRNKVGQTTEILSPSSSADTSYTSSNASINARQPLFNKGRWNQLEQAEFAAQEARALLAQEHQEVLLRVSQAYLDVLLADERAQQVTYLVKAAQISWDAARRSLDMGHGTRTDLDEALARLDMMRAQQLQMIQQQDFARRQLQVLVKVPVQSVVPLSGRGGLADSVGSLAALDEWLSKALSLSHELEVFQARLQGARKELDKQAAGHYPTLDAVAQYSNSSNENVARLGARYKTQSLGLQLQIPIYAGGQVLSQQRQALADIEVAEANLEGLRRDLGLRVQKEFRGLTEGQLRLVAQEQALRSAGQLVCSSQRSYAAGSRTLVDWLNAQRQQAQVEMDWMDARAGQLISAVRLWSLAGREATEILTDLEQEFEGASKAQARVQVKCAQSSRV
ncbi:MAG: TolC family outer membrane protein [Limnohabitans sp.]